MRVTRDVGSAATTEDRASSDAIVPSLRASSAIAWIALNRSAIGISPVGTLILAIVKALAPDCAVGVLTATRGAAWSTGAPSSMW